MDPLGALEAVETSGGEDEGVALALLEFFEAGAAVYIASNFYKGDVGPGECEDLENAASGAGGADATSGWEGVERPVGAADPDVAGVGAFGDGR